jgi:hypothetical protein
MEVLEDRTVPALFNWVGGDALQPTWWSRPDNWSPEGVPGLGDDVIIADPTWECVQTVPNEEISNLTVSDDSSLNAGLQGLIVDGNAVFDNSTFSGGKLTLNGAGALTDTVAWTGGELATSGTGAWTNTGTINVGGAATTYVTLGGTLNNDGTITVTSQIFYFDAGTLTNLADGTFTIQGDHVVVGTTSGPSNFNNSGTVQKFSSGDSDVTLLGVNLNNAADGTVNVQTGTLKLTAGGGTSAGGTFNVSTGATFDLGDGGQRTLTGSYTGSGGGEVLLHGSGRLAIGSDGATFDFPQDMFHWTGGAIDTTAGSLTNAPDGFITVDGDDVLLGGTLNNLGTITQQAASQLSLQQPNAVVNNSGLFDIQGDGSPGGSNEANQAFNNLPGGVFQKSAGTGTATVVGLVFNNVGTVNVSSRTLWLFTTVAQEDGSTHTLTDGTWNVFANSTLTFGYGDRLIANAATIVLDGPGANFTNLANNLAANSGTFRLLDGAAFTTPGDFANTGTLTIGLGSVLTVNGNYAQGPNATVEIQLGGTADTGLFGQLAVTGNVALDGTLTLTLVNGYTPTSADAFPIMTFASRNGTDFANPPAGFNEVFDDGNGNLNVIAQ